MTEAWPPTGYADPKPYNINDRLILSIALVLTLPIIALARPALVNGASAFSTLSTVLGDTTGLVQSPILYLLATFVVLVGWLLVSGAVIIIIHEAVHYGIGTVCGRNPQFQWSDHLGLKNPSIVVYEKGISRGENMLMLFGPFALLTPLCAVVMWSTSGILAATAATMLCMNAIASCADIYNVGRLLMMPRGTLFANFDREDGLETEFATPYEKTA